MMRSIPYYIVDVFAEKKYAGNQLAVFLNAGELSGEEMQQIAREVNFAESTFVLSDQTRDGGFDVRIFTPVEEMPFAGHPTLGTAHVIHQFLETPEEGIVHLNLKVGQIRVGLCEGYWWMRQINPSFGTIFPAKDIVPLLNISEEMMDKRFPIEEVSTGVPFLIIPLENLEAVKKVTVNLPALKEHLKRADVHAKMLFVFSPETYVADNDLNSRMFADELGVAEDAATGSANGCLLAYLLKHTYFGEAKLKENGLNIKVEQGYEMGRPSLLKHQGKRLSETEYEINIGGKVQLIAEGKWY